VNPGGWGERDAHPIGTTMTETPTREAPQGSWTPKILIVDDESVITDILSDFLNLEGYTISTAGDGPTALSILEGGVFDLIISDLKMEPMSGLQLLEEVKRRDFKGMVIIMTAFGTVETALEAMKKGAFDYILKPFKMEEVVQIVGRALAVKRLADENFELKETLSLYKMSEDLDVSLNISDILDTLLAFTQQHVHPDMVEVFIYDRKMEKVDVHRSLAAAGERRAGSWLNPSLVNEAVRSFRSIIGGTKLAAQYATIGVDLLPEHFIVVPLAYRKDPLGFVVASSFSKAVNFTEGHRKFLSTMGSRTALSIANARLISAMRATFRQTIQALARALEAMDKYTSGHSDRVTLYCDLTGKQMGLSPDEHEILINTALLHDIGKFGCHANLNKPGKLTYHEYEVFKQHPNFGVEILEPIVFLNPIIPGIKHHHERWDGKGYPDQLKEESIPLIARILAVADAYDAMTSNRAYRKAMSHKVAVGELQRCSGTQFDPQIVVHFIAAIETYRQEAQGKGLMIPQ
jgi:response regulator RpfG family c-di-GMP phosphodiesterase